jgi:hypothetical protein
MQQGCSISFREREMMMDYQELPKHLNCSHLGANSPVMMRLEGGNSRGGFCVEQYAITPPFLKFYGDAGEARQVFMSAVKCLPSFINLVLERKDCDLGSSSIYNWFQFDYRRPDYCVGIYCGQHGMSIIRNGAEQINKTDLANDLRAAHTHLAAIYDRFYNV